MQHEQPHVSIIILNWNGWKDTIECLESVLKNNYPNFHIILVDNFSENDSVQKIRNWALKSEPAVEQTNFPELVFPTVSKPIPFFEIEIERGEKIENIFQGKMRINPPTGSLILIKNHENSGFAAGNNLGIKIANKLFKNEYFYFLNNDTVIDSEALSTLVSNFENNLNYGVGTSAIYYYTQSNKIHNLGGKITVKATAYYYTTKSNGAKRRITFITGCALLIRKTVLEKVGLFSEKFFFGEEDFEFSWRLRKNGIHVQCVLESAVYHKVSISSKKLYGNEPRRLFLSIYARVVDMKNNLSYLVWWIWRAAVLIYSFFWLTLKFNQDIGITIKIILMVKKYSNLYDNANKSIVETILQINNL